MLRGATSTCRTHRHRWSFRLVFLPPLAFLVHKRRAFGKLASVPLAVKGVTVARYALYVGIGMYHRHSELEGCVADARAMAEVLKHERDGDEGWPQPDPVSNMLLTEYHSEVTQEDLAARVRWLLSGVQNEDVLFYFAGHGVDNDGELLLATSEDDERGLRSGYSIRRLIAEIRESRCKSATVILDCCNAGLATKVDVPEGTAILAGTGARQTAKERDGRGVFTETVVTGLQDAAADIMGQVTAISLYNYLAGALGHAKGQFPALKARTEKPVVLKKVKRRVDRDDLMKLRVLFSKEDSPRPVTPDHEAKEDQSVPPSRSRPYPWPDGVKKTAEQDEMDYYKRLRDAGLLEAFTRDGQKADLFWACLDSGEVKLTPLGQYYWNLAKENQIA